jgi:Fe-S oxidoreductase
MISALVLVVAIAACGTIFARRALLLTRLVRLGKPVRRFDDVPARLRNEAVIVLGQRKLFQRLLPGIMHAAIFWGFLVLLPTIFMAIIGIVSKDSTIPWLGHQGWFALAVDLFAVLVALGVATAFAIRKIQKPARFDGSHRGEADLILGLIFGIVATLLVWHASRIALSLNEYPASWSPVSRGLSHLMGAGDGTRLVERVAVWGHVAIILGFMTYLPHSKHLHIATAAINVYFGRTRARGRLEPLRFDEEGVAEEDIRFGTGTIADMTWKQMVDTMSCTECGRCQDVCPAYATGKALSPKLLIMGIRDQLFAEGPDLLGALARGETFDAKPLVGNAVTEEVVWDCVTCGACVRECPVAIEHVDHIVDLRRQMVMVDARFPAEAGTMLRDVERSANPWGKPQTDRTDWTEGLEIRVLEPGDAPPEVLFWVGCAPAYDERAREGARSTAKLLQRAGVDFAILGPRECCTGDPARRMGDEYTFQSYAAQNVETLSSSKVTKIVTTCPHCFNSLSNEYPDFGGSFEVMHHTELLSELVADGRLKPEADPSRTITYHDSCYLARHNDVREAPRAIVAAVGTPIEMEKSRERTFCCGAGGAHMWMEERGSQINEARARQASDTGASTLAVACPFCTVMLDDGMTSTGGSLAVVDVATLLVEAVERADTGPVPRPSDV